MELLELLKKLTSINSVFYKEREIGDFIFNYLKKLNIQVEKQLVDENRFNVIGEINNNCSETILLYGHIDTVSPSANWNDALVPKTSDDKLIGLGSFDMKAGIATIIKIIEDVSNPRYNIKFAFLADEENISEGSYQLVRSGFLNDVNYAICPEAGILENNTPYLGNITLGRRGRIVLEIHVTGKSAHATTPELGINAIEEASFIINRLKEISLTTHPELKSSSMTPLYIEGGSQGLSVPEKVRIIIDRHYVPPENPEQIIQDTNDWISSLKLRSHVEIKLLERPNPYLKPYIIDIENPFVKSVAKSINKCCVPKYSYSPSVADENRIAELGIQVVVIGVEGNNAHAEGEWISISSLYKFYDILRDIVTKM